VEKVKESILRRKENNCCVAYEMLVSEKEKAIRLKLLTRTIYTIIAW
jgi:hypothetical protein